MKLGAKNCLICNCEKSMPLDQAKLTIALGEKVDTIHTHLCRSQLAAFELALNEDTPLLVACTQEAPLFQEVAEELGKPEKVSFINIRENAGWSADAKDAHAKIAALLKSASHISKPARLKAIHSDGMCLVYGAGEQALEIAKLLNEKLSVTLLLSNDDEIVLPGSSDIPIYRGDIEQAEGSFGTFTLTINNYAPLMPSSRNTMDFVLARDGAKTECSVILDLSGKTPLFTGHAHRDGYKRVDAGDPAAALRAVLKLSEMVGEFEKPIYIGYSAEACAHGRSKQTGCSKCLDVCPAGAIVDAGDIVSIDSGICGGCGSCHSVCPTGAISYQYPQRTDIITRAQLMLKTYLEADGTSPVFLIHDDGFGADLITMMARYGRGLPANVIPFSMHAITTMGHIEVLALIASGAAQVLLLADPQNSDELSGLKMEIGLSDAILTGLKLAEKSRCRIINEVDPDVVEDILWSLDATESFPAETFTPAGSKRDIARLVFGKLHEQSPEKPQIIDLPSSAPYGRVVIDQSTCTLCMSCTSACPAAAIVDTPGEPKLRFIENACVQCALCVTTCPEDALSLTPQLNFTNEAMQPITLYEEEPFNCIVCDTPFATKSTIERISDQLAQKHAMFANEERSNLIQMCQDCRVEAQANSSEDPFSGGARPRVRSTDDYIEAEKKNLSIEDFLMEE